MPELDEEAINVLKNKIRVEEDSNRLKQQELLLVKRLEEIYLSYLDETTRLRQEIKILLKYYQEHAFGDDTLQDMLSGLSDRIERLERIAILQLGMRGNQDEAQKTRGELREELERRHIEKVLKTHYRTLRKLEEREAEFGERAPIELCNQLEDIREKIARLEEKLKKEAG